MDKAILWFGIVAACLAGTAAGVWLGPPGALVIGTLGALVVAVACWRSCHSEGSHDAAA